MENVKFPEVRADDSLLKYWSRTREQWLELIGDKLLADGTDEETHADDTNRHAEREAKLCFARAKQEREDAVEEAGAGDAAEEANQ